MSITMLMNMGFERQVCEEALRNTGGNVEQATDWIFSHTEGEQAPVAAPEEAHQRAAAAERRIQANITHWNDQ